MKKLNSFFYLWFLLPTIVRGYYFPDAGVDETKILGRFEIQFTEKSESLYGIKKIESPLLVDSRARIGRGYPHLNGGQQDKLLGTRSCEEGIYDGCYEFAPLRIRDRDFSLVPKAFHNDSTDIEEIHFQIISVYLTDSCGSQNAIRIGHAAPDTLPSLGEIESLNVTTISNFPAKAFFNLFVEVDVDSNKDGIVDMTLINKEPLVIQSNQLETFPFHPFYLNSDEVVAVFDKVSSKSEPIGWLAIKSENLDGICDNRSIEAVPKFEIRTFTVEETEGKVLLKWSVAFEDNIIGFNLWRARKNEEGKFIEVTKVTDELIPVQKVFSEKIDYVYEDQVTPENTYYYGLETVDLDGNSIIHLDGIISAVFKK